MKNILRLFAIWLLQKCSEPYMGYNDKKCSITTDDEQRFLVLNMPDGKVIPAQKNIIIKNSIRDKYFCQVVVELTVPIANILA